MTRLLARLLLAFAAVLAAPVVCSGLCIVLIAATSWRWDFHCLVASECISALLFVTAWLAIWHAQVTWNEWRRQLTFVSIFWSLGVGSIVGLVLAMMTDEENLGLVFAGLFWFVSWIPSTALIWRETARERAARLRAVAVGTLACPHCGYNLTGLHEARCPECGTQYTLNELFALLQEGSGDLESGAASCSHGDARK